jgi:hypothetical protein
MLGPYAEGNDGTEEVVFALFMGENHAGLTPLEKFGFILHPGKMSACYGMNSHQRVECPPEGEPSTAPTQPPAALPAPSTTNPVFPPTGTNTATAQPYWDGSWVRNYWEDNPDCNSGGLDYWVVQPGTDTGMFALKKGCFPPDWLNALTAHCNSYNWRYNGQCGVWDQGSIMSTYKKHGDLQIVRLKQDCLTTLGLTDFHEGPIHQYCVIGP